MRPTGFATARSRVMVSLACVALAVHTMAARSQQPSPDACSWLTPAQLQKTLGQRFAAPERAGAPPAYRGQAPGTTCHYNTEHGGSLDVVFIVYVDRSPAEAKATFQQLARFYQPSTKTEGIGDAAYVDKEGAIHVLKGKVRYYLEVSDAHTSMRQKQLRALAIQVAAEI